MSDHAHPDDPAGTPTDLFLALTPERVLEAVERAGLETRPVCYPLNSFENRVYEVELADKSRIIAKFYRPGRWSREQILEEHRFLTDCAEAEIPVGGVAPFPDDETVHQTENIFYALFERRGGRSPDEMRDDLARRLGMLTGRLHTVGAERDAPHRLVLSAEPYVRSNLDWLERHGTLPAHLEARYLDTGRRIADHLDKLLEGVEIQRVHGDLHLGNVLDRDGLLYLVDFDDMVIGPPVQDVWLSIPGRDRDADRQRQIFLEGYEQFRLFDRSTLRLVEPLRALRLVHYATWLARRWHDPIFPATWPQFGTEEYWQGETEALEEQLRLIENESLTDRERELWNVPVATEEPDEALTNKDYFWDWEDDDD